VTGRQGRALLAATAAVLAMSLAVAGCSSNGSGNSGQSAGSSSVVVEIPTAITSFNTDVQFQNPAIDPDYQIFETATRISYASGQPTVVGLLCTEWKQTSANVWSFTVRQGVTFSNGEKLTAKTFEDTLNLYQANKSGKMNLILPKFTIKATGDYTFDVTTKAANLYTLPMWMSFLHVVPPVYYAKEGPGGFGQAPIGTGPYVLDQWVKGSSVTLKANPTYWGTAPAIKQVTFKAVSDDSTRVADLQTGAADVITDVPPQLADRVKGLTNASLESTPGVLMVWLQMLPTKELANIKVRQAVQMALDRNAIISGVLNGAGQPLPGLYLSTWADYDPNNTGPSHDQAAAKKLLADAGYPNGFTLQLNYITDASPLAQQVSEAIAAQLQQVGITVTLNGYPQATAVTEFKKQNAPGLYLSPLRALLPDASWPFSTSYTTYAAHAYRGNQPEVDQMVAAAEATTDPAARKQAYANIQNYIINTWGVYYGLYQSVDYYGVAKSLNWKPSPNSYVYAFDMKKN
jgi:peptide/nickel transport system substrate-binding protein